MSDRLRTVFVLAPIAVFAPAAIYWSVMGELLLTLKYALALGLCAVIAHYLQP